MSEVKRYDLTESCDTGEIDITPVPPHFEGRFVSWEDYDALKAECESNLKSSQYSAETNRKIALKNGEMHDEIISLKAERDALANENLAIKAKIAIHAGGFSVCPVCSHEDPSESDDIVWMVNETPTTATDAYASQLRAEELSEAVDIINEKAADYAHGTLEWEVCHWLAITLNRKAANLRKENGND